MRVFVDTSALMAVLNADDSNHPRANATWQRELESDTSFISSNYVLLETTALLQHRLGVQAVRVFEQDVVPAFDVEWVEREDHRAGVSAVLSAGQRKLSLVDCISFELMRKLAIDTCFTFDRHFEKQGFTLLG
jgi:predicted nucleic acid-binding protein